MKCTGVYFLGHAPGSIQVPPAAVMDKVALIENTASKRATHLLLARRQRRDRQATSRPPANGLAASPPIVTGRGMIVATDRGQIEVYDIATGKRRSRSGSLPRATPPHAAAHPTCRRLRPQRLGRRYAAHEILDHADRQSAAGRRNRKQSSPAQPSIIRWPHSATRYINVRRPKDRGGFVVAATRYQTWPPDLGNRSRDAAGRRRRSSTTQRKHLPSPMPPAPCSDSMKRPSARACKTAARDSACSAATTATHVGRRPGPRPRGLLAPRTPNWLLLYNPTQSQRRQVAPTRWPASVRGHAARPRVHRAAQTRPGLLPELRRRLAPRNAISTAPRTAVPLEYKPPAVIKSDPRNSSSPTAAKRSTSSLWRDQPQPHLEEVKEADVGPHPIESPSSCSATPRCGRRRHPFAPLQIADAGTGRRNQSCPRPRKGDHTRWATCPHRHRRRKTPRRLRHRRSEMARPASTRPAGRPAASAPRRNPAGLSQRYHRATLRTDGKPLATLNVEQPLATGPVAFLQRFVATAADGTLLVVDKP